VRVAVRDAVKVLLAVAVEVTVLVKVLVTVGVLLGVKVLVLVAVRELVAVLVAVATFGTVPPTFASEICALNNRIINPITVVIRTNFFTILYSLI